MKRVDSDATSATLVQSACPPKKKVQTEVHKNLVQGEEGGSRLVS